MKIEFILALSAVGLFLLAIVINVLIVKFSTPKCRYIVDVDYAGKIIPHIGLSFVGYNDTDMKKYLEIATMKEKDAIEAIKEWEKNPKQPKEAYCVTYLAADGTKSRVFFDSEYPYYGCEVGKWWYSIIGMKKDHMRKIYKTYGNNTATVRGKSLDSQAPDKEFDTVENTHIHVNMLRTLKENNFPVVAIALIGLFLVLALTVWNETQPPNVIVTGQNVTTQVKK